VSLQKGDTNDEHKRDAMLLYEEALKSAREEKQSDQPRLN
jgi:hypothetical protein